MDDRLAKGLVQWNDGSVAMYECECGYEIILHADEPKACKCGRILRFQRVVNVYEVPSAD